MEKSFDHSVLATHKILSEFLGELCQYCFIQWPVVYMCMILMVQCLGDYAAYSPRISNEHHWVYTFGSHYGMLQRCTIIYTHCSLPCVTNKLSFVCVFCGLSHD